MLTKLDNLLGHRVFLLCRIVVWRNDKITWKEAGEILRDYRGKYE